MSKEYDEVKYALFCGKMRKPLSTHTLEYCLKAIEEKENAEHCTFRNYPTWLVATHISNNRIFNQKYDTLLHELWSDHASDFNIIGTLAQTIRADLEKVLIKEEPSIATSLLNYCDNIIDYRQIAQRFIND